jgi:hypothetical protein
LPPTELAAPPPPPVEPAPPSSPAEPVTTPNAAVSIADWTVEIVDAEAERHAGDAFVVEVKRGARTSSHRLVSTTRSEVIGAVEIARVADSEDALFAITIAEHVGEDCVREALQVLIVQLTADGDLVTRAIAPLGTERSALDAASDMIVARFALRENAVVVEKTLVRTCLAQDPEDPEDDPMPSMIRGCRFPGISSRCVASERVETQRITLEP